ncbi:hypothetical protein CPB86DRAFT_485123 [Serendipita vermifera]|nr:hypothetical protein CPB86DRAFT_485123 [Serendipita vermifera]
MSAQQGGLAMAESCFIDQLPTEILREIFICYYHNNQETPVKLLHVSRRWYAVAYETQLLWSILHFHLCSRREKCDNRPLSFLTRHKWELSVAIRCFSLAELLKATERLGLANFTLFVDGCSNTSLYGLEYVPDIKSVINNRCTTLVVSAKFIMQDPIGILWNLEAINSLTITGGPSLWWNTLQSGFFQAFVNSPSLNKVTLRNMVPAYITQQSNLFTPVEHLDIHIATGWARGDFENHLLLKFHLRRNA